MEIKTCSKCGGTFSTKQCGPCRKSYARAYKAAYKLNHPEKWKASNNTEKEKARKAAYTAANREKILAYKAEYRLRNAEKIRKESAEYRKREPEKTKAAVAAWRKANPDSMRVRWQTRRAREQDANGKISPGLEKKLFALQQGKCACCGSPLIKWHLDHIMPLALGGKHEDANMQLLAPKCNLQKNAKHPVDFMQSRGYLI